MAAPRRSPRRAVFILAGEGDDSLIRAFAFGQIFPERVEILDGLLDAAAHDPGARFAADLAFRDLFRSCRWRSTVFPRHFFRLLRPVRLVRRHRWQRALAVGIAGAAPEWLAGIRAFASGAE